MHKLLSNTPCGPSPSASPALFRRLNRPPQVQLNLGSRSNLNTTVDLKEVIDTVTEVNQYSQEDKSQIKFKDEDLLVVGHLGTGAGGTVVKVLHKPTGLVLAKKKISAFFGDEGEQSKMKKNLVREVKFMKTCRSSYIVSFFGAHFSDGDVELLIEYMDLGSIDSIYKKFGCIEQDVAVHIIFHALKGLDYLWSEKKIVHRDIKPSNILVNSRGEVKIGDFGISKDESSSTNGGSFTGTQLYLAPERITNIGKITVAADLWALGLTVIEITTGSHPYMALRGGATGSVMDLFEIIINEPSPNLPEEFDPDLRKIVSVCLSKDPIQRSTPRILLETNYPSIISSDKLGTTLTKWAINLITAG